MKREGSLISQIPELTLGNPRFISIFYVGTAVRLRVTINYFYHKMMGKNESTLSAI